MKAYSMRGVAAGMLVAVSGMLVAVLCLHVPAAAKGKRGRYVRDRTVSETTLRDLAGFSMRRESPATRLFVESYFARSLVAAHEALAHTADSTESRAWVERALAFADSLVSIQDRFGYLPIGYDAGYLADMAAALGVFAVVEPYADEQRLEAYEKTTRTFVESMRRDGMLRDSGAVGVGWPHPFDGGQSRVWRSNTGWYHEPYLVSTTLAGISMHAWLYHRTGKEHYKTLALRSLDYTLSTLRSDGSFPGHEKIEGGLRAAAYAADAWVTVDRCLDDAQLRERLRVALAPHVDWLLEAQTKDGVWPGDVRGDFARAPNIINFLVWYDQRCERRRDIQRALQRADKAWTKPSKKIRESYGLYLEGEDHEVLRAFSGRSLAALLLEHELP